MRRVLRGDDRFRGLLACVLLLLTGLAYSSAIRAQTVTAELTLIVRDATGAPLPGVHAQLLVDKAGVATPIDGSHGQVADAQGRIRFPGLAVGYTYIVQFHGVLPDGRTIQPIAAQNGGQRVDGGGVTAGFGIRVVGAQVTQPFVFAGTQAPTGQAAIPLFDLAASVQELPRPVLPGSGTEISAAAAVGLVDTPAADDHGHLPVTAPAAGNRRWRWWGVGLLLYSGVVVLVLWRMGARRPDRGQA